MITILTLDLGTTTGWAVSQDNFILSGSQSFKNSQFDGAGMRFLKFKKWLTELHTNMKHIDELYYEAAPFSRGGASTHSKSGFVAILQLWCEDHKIPYMGIHLSTIKKFISGNGKASKEDVINAIKKLCHEPKDDNEADALALLYLALSKNLSASPEKNLKRKE